MKYSGSKGRKKQAQAKREQMGERKEARGPGEARCKNTCAHTCMHANMYIHAHTCTLPHTHTCTHTHTHTHIADGTSWRVTEAA